MITILVSWLLWLCISLNLGLFYRNVLNLKGYNHPFITIILGLFSLTIITFTSAFFYHINLSFFIALIILTLVLSWIQRQRLKKEIQRLKAIFFNLIPLYRILFLVVFILTLLKSATAPYLLDNESYYIQTIKWINEYGFVNGVANLHPFFGQHSGWHVLQASLNFSFIGPYYNDINGFLLTAFSLYAFERLNKYKTSKDLSELIIGLTPIFNVFIFQFVSSPSPDVPIFLFSQLLIYLFIKNFKTIDTDLYIIFLSIVLFILLIKVTPIALVLFPVYLFFKLLPSNKKIILPSLLLGSLVLGLFFFKNYIISGYLMFPSSFLDLANPDWKIPETIQQFYYDNTAAYSLIMSAQEYQELSFGQKIIQWIQLPKLSGLFNKTMLILMIIIPIIIRGFSNRKAYYTVYLIGLIHLILLFFTSAQYRFYFNFFIFFSLLAVASCNLKPLLIKAMLVVSIIVAAIPLFISIPLSSLTNNQFAMDLHTFQLNQLLIPHKNSNYSGEFIQVNDGLLPYSSPTKGDFFWNTGDGTLPCSNRQVIDYFNTYYQHSPIMRTDQIKDGFKSTSRE